MNPFTYLPFVPALLLVLFGIAAPHVSALLTRSPGYVAGALTALFAAADGFLVQWAHQDRGYDWKHGLFNALVAWGVGLGTQVGVLRGTYPARRLHAKGPQMGDGPAVRTPGDAGRTNLGGVIGGLVILLALILWLAGPLTIVGFLIGLVIGVLVIVFV